MKSAKVIKELETTLVNYETGEEISSSKTREIIHETEPDFVKVYLACVASFANYPTALNPILLAFLRRMSYAGEKGGKEGHVVYATKFTKEQIARESEVGVDRVNQALRQFVKSGVFIYVARAVYSVNAEYFGRGSWKDVKRLRDIQAEFKLSKGGSNKFKAKFTYDGMNDNMEK